MYIHKNDRLQVCHSVYLDNSSNIFLLVNIPYIKIHIETEVRAFVLYWGQIKIIFGRTNQIKTSFFWSSVHDTEGEVTIMECTMVTHHGIHFSITNNRHVIWKMATK